MFSFFFVRVILFPCQSPCDSFSRTNESRTKARARPVGRPFPHSPKAAFQPLVFLCDRNLFSVLSPRLSFSARPSFAKAVRPMRGAPSPALPRGARSAGVSPAPKADGKERSAPPPLPPSAPENAGAKPTPTSAFRTGALTKERGKTKERNRKSSFPVRGERSREAISATTNPSRTHRVMRHLTQKKKNLFWRKALFFVYFPFRRRKFKKKNELSSFSLSLLVFSFFSLVQKNKNK